MSTMNDAALLRAYRLAACPRLIAVLYPPEIGPHAAYLRRLQDEIDARMLSIIHQRPIVRRDILAVASR